MQQELNEIGVRIEALQIEVQKLDAREQEIIAARKDSKVSTGAAAWAQGRELDSIQVDETGREELVAIQRRRTFISEALAAGKDELERARGQHSLEVCAQKVRPTILKHVAIILKALREISDANEAIVRAREQFHSQGIKTDSVPYCLFNIGGTWNDPHGGRVVGYCREVARDFPELQKQTE